MYLDGCQLLLRPWGPSFRSDGRASFGMPPARADRISDRRGIFIDIREICVLLFLYELGRWKRCLSVAQFENGLLHLLNEPEI